MDFDIDFEIDYGNAENEFTKITKPIKTKSIPTAYINYDNALKLAKETDLKKDTRIFTFLSGNFVFGDYIEALIVENNWIANEMIISTLSLSKENIYSLRNLLEGGFVKKLSLIVSGFFYSHEKFKLVKKIHEELINEKWEFEFAVSEVHTKTVVFDISNVNKKGYVVIQGSANLRSSDSIEQLEIEENEDLYNFIRNFQLKIIETHNTIKTRLRGKKLWDKLN